MALPAQAQSPKRGDIVITEFFANPGGTISDANGEWFEIYNATHLPINLQNWYVQDSSASGIRPFHKITSSLVIQPYGFLVLGNTTNTTNNGGVPVTYAYGGALAFANSLDKIRIVAPSPGADWVNPTRDINGNITDPGNPAPDSVIIDRVRFASAAISAQNGISRELKNVGFDNHNIDDSNIWMDAPVTAVFGPGGRGTPGVAGNTEGIGTLSTASATTTVATSGWRVLAPPLSTLTVGTLAGINLVQGLSDEFATFNPNLFTAYSGNENAAYRGYTLPGAKSDALTPGRGFLWYFFADGGPEAGDARGTSRRAALPLTLAATGGALTASTSVTFTASERSGATTDFFLLGNPFAQTFSLSGVSATSGTLSNAFQIWNGTSWITRDRLVPGSSDVAVWQGFFAEITGPSFPLTVSYDYGAVTGTSPVLIGKGGPALARLGLRLSGTAPSGAAISDEAAALVARDQGALGWDADDASKLDPLSGPGFTVGLVGDKGGAAVVQAQRSVPETLAGPLDVPLRLAVPAPARLTLSWSGAATLPSSWRVSLVDRRTGATVDVRADTAYAFEATAADADRLALVLRPGGATGVDAPGEALASDALVVSAPYPQPARAWVRMSVAVGAPQRVVVEVYDVLGRRVSATALEGLAAGQEQTVTLDVSLLPSGTYLVRVSGADGSVTRRLTVAR